MKRKQLLWIRLLLWSLVILSLCSLPLPKIPSPNAIPHIDKIAHWGLFLLFSAFALGWLQETQYFTKSTNILWVLLLTAIYGGGIEWLQGKYFARSADIWDWVADMVGGVTGILLYPQLHRWRAQSETYLRSLFFKHRG